ncbi:hypothetical protein HYH03_014447 [Edaphochlamys debaryana]|uniref:Peptidase M11 gametolysin domain-containing protein n=1 Tax=Edaphochlamys debaryana TaxID=47281 RepID=A0A835XU53_9CHLO|nr:hypothetical protein HYH03_014447 [Edaphochlamys debaryana]|eukprot:KAG2486950.1 hypothetical protein HYH03_014447 [Edaphochlamys debaryana]
MSCPSAPELFRLGWATPLITLNATSLAENVVRQGIRLPATHLGGVGAFIRVIPNWMGGLYDRNVYISLRGSGGGDTRLPTEFNSKLSVHEARKAVDNIPLATGDPHFNLVHVLGPAEAMDLSAHRLVIETRGLVDGGTRVLVDLCRYRTSAAECSFPPISTICAAVSGYPVRPDADRPTSAFSPDYLGAAWDLGSLEKTCSANPRSLEAGAVKCWGYNSEGRLGNPGLIQTYVGGFPGDMGSALPPVDLGGGLRATVVAAGYMHTCALIQPGGRVKCWGSSESGQCGDKVTRGDGQGEMGDNLPFVDLGTDVSSVQRLVTFGNMVCALVQPGGRVKCWGDLGYAVVGNSPGQMGANLSAVPLGNFTATDLAVGYQHACAVLQPGGIIKCLGMNSYGELGYGDTDPRTNASTLGARLPPVSLGPGLKATTVAAGMHHTCAVLSPGSVVKCWGRGSEGQLGNGNMLTLGDGPGEMPPPAVNLTGGTNVTKLVAGNTFTCALIQPDGGVKCWGDGYYGSLGLGTQAALGDDPGEMGALPFVDLGFNTTVVDISAGTWHACAILNPGRVVKCWGYNVNAELGLGSRGYGFNKGDQPGEMGDELPVMDLGPEPPAPAPMPPRPLPP